MPDYGYTYEIDSALEHFELTLRERWYQVVKESVFNQVDIPAPLSGLPGSLPEYRTAEMFAHINYGQVVGGCAYVNWIDAGAQGSPGSISCEGKIRESYHYDLETIEYQGVETEVPEYTRCVLGDLLGAVEQWCWNDRKLISDALPPFATHNLTALEDARNALVSMAGDFGATPDAGGAGADDALVTGLTLTNTVDLLFVDRDRDKDWMAEWTGAAADRAANGIFASTKPTLFNHAIIANGLGTLINERATIIHTYQQNSLSLVRSATAALDQTTTTTSDHTNEWKAVQGLGMALSIVPVTAPYGAVISLVGWLGEQFLKETRSVSFSFTPHEVARNLHDAVVEMDGALTGSEAAYTQDVLEFRTALNAVSSTFLELYDISENR
ncbi:hypothetical protein BLA60_24680 [Actinophytocola xinjiangensis]|uniref:Uncharacterized protein n=1 Tax=Actinophytocola xinjiangensis TaxID=485602 RepID=A0A7Z0WII9_9PSEU|nr:hypothetical protein [Actinophytocola xinjiangensis]OLF08067.1 hypothetical protein BLA60_24680 [Actinophytocola xinjiangensis]